MNHNPINVCNFIRVSTKKQDTQRQKTELKKYALDRDWNVTETIETIVSGSKEVYRKDIEQLLEGARKRKYSKVIVLEISRLGRKAKDVRNLIDELHSYGVSVVFKNLGGIESLDVNGKESLVSNLIIAIYSELAQEERRLIVERIHSGLENAKRKGKTLGRAKGTSESKETFLKKHNSLVRDLNRGLSLSECMKLHSVSKNTVIKVKKLVNAPN